MNPTRLGTSDENLIPAIRRAPAMISPARRRHLRPRVHRAGTGLFLAVVALAPPAWSNVFEVQNTMDDGLHSLRWAIGLANARSGADEIEFHVNGTIRLQSELPALEDDGTTIRGETAPGSNRGVLVTIKRTSPAVMRGLAIDGARDCAIRGLQLEGFDTGIEVVDGWRNVVGEPGVATQVIVRQNGTGIRFSGDSRANRVRGCVITDNNGDGIELTEGALTNQIGGPENGEGNEIALNGRGIHLWATGLVAAQDNTFQGNVIDGSTEDGVLISGHLADQNTVKGNVITLNAGEGVRIEGGQGNIVQDNRVGVDESGEPRGNLGHGIVLTGIEAPPWLQGTYGDTVPPLDSEVFDNTVAANNTGIAVSGGGERNQIHDNLVGTDPSGTIGAGYGNTIGVALVDGARDNRIEDNVIASSEQYGVWVNDASSDLNDIYGNSIGTDQSGTIALPNGTGVKVSGGAGTNVWGNLISGNKDWGIIVQDYAPDYMTWGHRILDNRIGIGATGHRLANGAGGIWIALGGFNIDIGEEAMGGNLIRHNGGPGVKVGEENMTDHQPFGVRIINNQICDNDGEDIDLTWGGNYELVAPTISAVSSTEVRGNTNLRPHETYPGTEVKVQVFYDHHLLGCGVLVGQTVAEYLGNWELEGVVIPVGAEVRATNTAAVDAAAPQTSEFSEPRVVAAPPPGGPGHPMPSPFASLSVTGANPFAQSTEFTLSTPVPTMLSVKVFDAKGRLVRVLHAGQVAAGQHVIRWDGIDASGHRAASGTYFARAEMGGECRVQRLVLLR